MKSNIEKYFPRENFKKQPVPFWYEPIRLMVFLWKGLMYFLWKKGWRQYCFICGGSILKNNVCKKCHFNHATYELSEIPKRRLIALQEKIQNLEIPIEQFKSKEDLNLKIKELDFFLKLSSSKINTDQLMIKTKRTLRIEFLKFPTIKKEDLIKDNK